ncbi:MAG: hypothetical protein K8F91_19645, partial [Candidatus Obscuribacterales bacterium]|nr:hypothetical protein [Candidatus Obscuribacterales bacterium]
GGGHVVTITGINHGPPVRIGIDNQWGKRADHQDTLMGLSARDVYFAMLDPLTASEELTTVIRHDREQGQRNAWDELDYERLRIISNKKIEQANKKFGKNFETIPCREIEMDVINTLASTFDPRVKPPDEWEKPGIMDKLGQVTAHLPRDSQIRIQHEEARLGLISNDEYKQALTDYGKFTKTREGTIDQRNEFARLLGELAPSERADIIEMLKH